MFTITEKNRHLIIPLPRMSRSSLSLAPFPWWSEQGSTPSCIQARDCHTCRFGRVGGPTAVSSVGGRRSDICLELRGWETWLEFPGHHTELSVPELLGLFWLRQAVPVP